MGKIDEFVKAHVYKLAFAILLIGIGSGIFSFLLHRSVEYVTFVLGTTKKFDLLTTTFSVLMALAAFLLTKNFFKDTNGSGYLRLN